MGFMKSSPVKGNLKKGNLNLSLAFCSGLLLSSCQMGYLIKNGWGQLSLLASREPLEKALIDPEVQEEEKRKIRLAMEVREFANSELGLKVDQIYTSYVKLKRPYVTWVVSASPKQKLESYLWSFPIVGKMPYKGFFTEAEALEEESFLPKTMDTYVRGVSAYSTLGWFKDPILSSMMRYKDYDLVDTLIHELVHATLYIKHQADFNERFAVFLGHKGRELFYLKKEGANSPTLKIVQDENHDEELFSAFITQEIKTLDGWYGGNEAKALFAAEPKAQSDTEPEAQAANNFETLRQLKFTEIKVRFNQEIAPKLKTKTWSRFPDMKLNNARLSVFKTYMKNLDHFQKVYSKVGDDFKKFLDQCKKLENHPNPEQGLADLI
jgi:predicted aminopeptidase